MFLKTFEIFDSQQQNEHARCVACVIRQIWPRGSESFMITPYFWVSRSIAPCTTKPLLNFEPKLNEFRTCCDFKANNHRNRTKSLQLHGVPPPPSSLLFYFVPGDEVAGEKRRTTHRCNLGEVPKSPREVSDVSWTFASSGTYLPGIFNQLEDGFWLIRCQQDCLAFCSLDEHVMVEINGTFWLDLFPGGFLSRFPFGFGVSSCSSKLIRSPIETHRGYPRSYCC